MNMRLSKKKNDQKYLPYGAWSCAGSAVIFDREYRPIVRVFDGAGIITARAHYKDGTEFTAAVPWENAVPCAPDEKIGGIEKEFWFYDSDTTPERCTATLDAVVWILLAIPCALAEIERRQRAAGIR